MKFFALYLASAANGVYSISRPGRTNAYSPLRRRIITQASTANVGANASHTKPATISSCLNSWGDCGKAKNWPSCTRLGTK